MTDDFARVECEKDGEGYQTFVCKHLFSDPKQAWYSQATTDDNPWPDAWCGICDEIYLRDGTWTDDNLMSSEIRLLCHHCYERLQAQEIPLVDDNGA